MVNYDSYVFRAQNQSSFREEQGTERIWSKVCILQQSLSHGAGRTEDRGGEAGALHTLHQFTGSHPRLDPSYVLRTTMLLALCASTIWLGRC